MSDTELLAELIAMGAEGASGIWRAIYEIVVWFTLFIVEYVHGETLYEDGSWVGGCEEFLNWGCID